MLRRIWMLFWLSITIAACSPSLSTTLPPTQINTSAETVTATALNTATDATSITPTSPPEPAMPVIQGEDCGQIMMLGPNPPRDATALEAENCFWLAFQQCSIATITVTMRGVDSGYIHTFTVQQNDNNCTVVDSLQTYAAASPQSNLDVFACVGLEQKDGGLLFLSCGEQGDIFVPLPRTQ
jgi:hypothetical protein